MQKILIVVDMQNDFIDGALGTPEAVAIVQRVEQKIREFPGKVIFTRDTHEECYLETQEGKHLPVPHCIKGTKGWEICPQLEALREAEAIDKVLNDFLLGRTFSRRTLGRCGYRSSLWVLFFVVFRHCFLPVRAMLQAR